MRTLKTIALAAFALFSLCASAQDEHVTIQGDHSELDVVIQLPVGLKKGTATSLPIYETARTYDGAELIVHGDADRIVPYTYGQRFHYLNTNSRWILMDGADHMFSGMEKQVAHAVAQFLAQTFKH